MIEATQIGSIVQQTDGVELSTERQDVNAQDTESFSDLLSNAINGVDETMKNSEAKVEQFVSGETDNLHDVMISMQRAKLSFNMMVEIRNKAVETYQEISRMQI